MAEVFFAQTSIRQVTDPALDGAGSAPERLGVGAEPLAIAIRGVSYTYAASWSLRALLTRRRHDPAVTVFDDLHVTVGSRERVAVVGHNGAGKSTLLKLIAGYLHPTRGDVFVHGQHTVRKQHRTPRVGMSTGDGRSFFWRLSGQHNLEFFGALAGLYGKELTQSITRVITAVDLLHVRHRRVQTYSTGMRQRLTIARAMLGDPTILVLDEPTRGLDDLAAERVRNILSPVNYRGTLIMSTNRLEDVTACQRVWVLRGGLIVLDVPSAGLESIRAHLDPNRDD